MKVLVTGGAGYIGSVTANLLADQGYEVGVVDSLENGDKNALQTSIKLFEGSIDHPDFIQKTLRNFQPEAILHFAAYALVEESFLFPEKYYQNNVLGSYYLALESLSQHVQHFIFSSSCSVYGVPKTKLITEKHPCDPINPYGETKFVTEKMLAFMGKKFAKNTCSLRYFNVAGMDLQYGIGEHHEPETHLIPNIFNKILNDEEVILFGNDYPTHDGTCIRDYIHVRDVAQAHVVMLEHLMTVNNKQLLYNIGTGKGYSNRTVVELVGKLLNKKPRITFLDRRQGDPPVLVANANSIRKDLGFKPTHSDIQEILESHWHFLQKKT